MIFSKLKTRLAQEAWEKHYQVPKHLQYIESLYQEVNGFTLSMAARQEEPRLDLTYGEIDLYSFLALMSLVKPDEATIFCDLGAGLAKTVVAFTACYQPQLAYGIEILAPLHAQAQKKLNQTPYNDKIKLLHQDMLMGEWPQVNLMFINVASFVPEIWDQLQQKLQQHPIAIIVSCVKPLNQLTHYEIYPTKVETSWGIVSAYIHRRLA